MNEPAQTIPHKPRWPPALAILVVIFLLAALPGHVYVLPVWVSYLAALAVLAPMAGVALTKGNTLWPRIERTMIILLAAAYVANTIAEVADMIEVITLHPSGNNAFFAAFVFGRDLDSQRSDFFFTVLANRWGRAARAGERLKRKAGMGVSAIADTRELIAWLEAIVPRLSISWLQYGDGFQSHRCLAAHPSRQDVDDDRKHDLALDDGHHPVTRHQRYPELTAGMPEGVCPETV
jgi:hypothetical protein